jgi:hypothetical protein
MLNLAVIRSAMAALQSDHDAAGSHRPKAMEVFAPIQHANALDPHTAIVVGARGTGKSFWAGVLEQESTRNVAALAYPNLGLENLIVVAGYTGFDGEDLIGPQILSARVPDGKEEVDGFAFWQAVIFRAAKKAIDPDGDYLSIREILKEYGDPEDFSAELKKIDRKLAEGSKTLVVTFDALDTISRTWLRSTQLIDSLLQVVWSLRIRKSIRAKVFIRPEQLNDENLRFIELPKLRSSAVHLEWAQAELYGLLFWRLVAESDVETMGSLQALASKVSAPLNTDWKIRPRKWRLISSSLAQEKAMNILAGPYMGRGSKKGGTYDWPYKHLADANGKVTPRSFIKLFQQAATIEPLSETTISPEGIRHGLREASRVRVDQLGVEYPWVKRALAPLAGLMIPCEVEEVFDRWEMTNTVRLIMRAAGDPESGFLPPFRQRGIKDPHPSLAAAMEKIGMIAYRSDGRIDIPDLFRVAAAMLKKGGTTPVAKN